MKVFYSWQSDLNHDTHLKFIRTALEQAIAQAGSDLKLEEARRPELDEAAKNRVGAENIVSTILRKIEAAAVYVADVTPITRTQRGRLVPNPNVLFELGWASRAINYERTIMVMNDADGHEIKDMPFDIVQRPIITYSLKPSSSPEKKEKELQRLADALTGAIATNLAAHIKQQASTKTITRQQALPDDPSLWKTEIIEMQDSSGRLKPIILPGKSRMYVRVSPDAWSKGVPSPMEFVKAKDNMRPESLPGHTTGSASSGRCTEGALRYWRAHDNSNLPDAIRTGNFSVFFENTGELWTFIDTFFKATGGTMIDPPPTAKALKHTLANSHAFLNHFKASPLRQVEAGIVGMAQTRLPTGQNSARQSLKSSILLSKLSDNWDDETQQQFRLDFYAKLYDAYGSQPAALATLTKHEA